MRLFLLLAVYAAVVLGTHIAPVAVGAVFFSKITQQLPAATLFVILYIRYHRLDALAVVLFALFVDVAAQNHLFGGHALAEVSNIRRLALWYKVYDVALVELFEYKVDLLMLQTAL